MSACGGPTPAATTGAVTEPAATLSVPNPGGPPPQVIGCIDILEAECVNLAVTIARILPDDRGAPFAIEIHLFPCIDGAPICPKSLVARTGSAIVEYPNGGEPIAFQLAGPPAAPKIEPAESVWSGPIEPSSKAAGGPGPFRYDTGHCGLLHMVDFDRSFWVPIGEISGDGQALINQEQGVLGLAGPDRAQYQGTAGFSMRLARFPGAKRFFLCD